MKKLLIVDDDQAMRTLCARRLARTYEVFDTGEPEQALALALKHKPDAILLDLNMPKFDGFELCQNFRSLSYTSDLPIFVITGQSGNYKEASEAMGATGYFEKPIDFKNLEKTLAETLNAHPTPKHGPKMIKMRMTVKLKGTGEDGKEFHEDAETETICSTGFQCVSARNLQIGAIVDVFLGGQGEKYSGKARITESAAAGLQRNRYRLDFDGDIKEWILQGE